MSHDDTLLAIFDAVNRIGREQAMLIERVDQVIQNNQRLEKRIDVLEERTQSLTWWKQTRSALLWIAAIAGAVTSGIRFIGK